MKNNENKELGMGWHDFMVFCRGLTGVLEIIAAIILAIASFFGLSARWHRDVRCYDRGGYVFL